MNNDPELKRLIDTWKEDDMLATQQLFRPGLLSWRNRAQSIAALVTLVLFIATVGATWIKAWLRGNWQLAVLAVVMTAGLVVFANIVATIRRRSAQTVELLAGSPEDVLQGTPAAPGEPDLRRDPGPIPAVRACRVSPGDRHDSVPEFVGGVHRAALHRVCRGAVVPDVCIAAAPPGGTRAARCDARGTEGRLSGRRTGSDYELSHAWRPTHRFFVRSRLPALQSGIEGLSTEGS